VGYFGVIGVGGVDGVGLSRTGVAGERLATIVVGSRVVGLAVMLNKIRNPRVRAGGVVRRVGERQDVLVRADGEALDLAELGVLELFAKFLGKVGPASLSLGKVKPRQVTGLGDFLLCPLN